MEYLVEHNWKKHDTVKVIANQTEAQNQFKSIEGHLHSGGLTALIVYAIINKAYEKFFKSN